MLRISSLFICVLFCSSAYAKRWRNTDGSRTFDAELISVNGTKVTMKKDNGSITSFDLAMLHPDDQAWILRQGKKQDPSPTIGSAFGELSFGDNRETVAAKLSKSTFVETDVNRTFVGRTGLNGIYRTKKNIGGLRCNLFFDWTTHGTLREVTLQTQLVPEEQYDDLKKNWNLFIQDLSKIHGRPVQGNPYPSRNKLQDGAVIGSHLWRTSNGHSVILGTGQERDLYNVVVRITTEIINPVRSGNSAPSTPSGPVFPD